MEFFTFEGNYFAWESLGAGPPLLLLHGNTGSSRMMLPLARALSERYRVISFDLLGCGQSQRLSQWPTRWWDANTAMLSAFLREQEISRIAAAGSSGGGLIAILLALREPERVCCVIADSVLGSSLSPEAAEELLRRRENPPWPERYLWRAAHGEDWREVVDTDTATIRRFAAEGGDIFHGRLAALTCPLLLFGSRQDELIPEIEERYREIQSLVPQSRAHVVDRGRHPAMLTARAEFLPIALEFLERTEA